MGAVTILVLLCFVVLMPISLSSDLDTLRDVSEQLKGVGSSWNTSNGNPCNWQGIQCDGGTVTNITLSGMTLRGTIPPTVGLLQSLIVLDLSKNGLFGTVPVNLSKCKSLETIDLSANLLSGPVPADLHNLTSLQVLDLSSNSLNGSIPNQLGSLSRLTQLNLANNGLTGSIPAGLGGLELLQSLSLSQNNLFGPLPEQLVWKSIQWVNLASNFLSGQIPHNICASGVLEVLLLTNNAFNGTLPENLGSCGALTNLRVGYNFLNGQIPATIGKLGNLTYFEANQNLFTGAMPRGWSGCKSLALLNLANNGLAGNISEDLGNVPTLQELHLAKNSFSGTIPVGLSQCKLLSVLDLSNNDLVGGLPSNLCSINRLVLVRLQGNQLTGHIPSTISDCQQLLELQLGDNNLNGAIPSTIGLLLNLQVLLNLSANHLTGTIPDSIGSLSKLVSLDLSHNELSGQIPSLASMVSLINWDFSYNMLSGPVPQIGSVLNSSSSDYASSYAHNAGLCGGPLPPCEEIDSHKTMAKVISFWQAAGITVACLIVVVSIFAGLGFVVMYKHRMPAMVDPSSSQMVSHIFVEHLRRAVVFDSIKEAIKNKDNLISSNHFSTMYIAVMPSGLVLAAKKFHSSDKSLVFHYKRLALDLDKLWRLSHENVMQPIGYVVEENLAVILYDFVPTCSLGQQLHDTSEQVVLPWAVRYLIAIRAAQGLTFLHHSCQPPMVHMDVNSYNVFLGQHSEVKVGDIEVAKLVDPSKNTGSVSAVAGSFGHIAPEYAFTMRVTAESNVYSFGVILLELLTGRLPVDEALGDGVDLVRWVHGASLRGETPEQILDVRISTQSFAAREEMLAVLKIALLCTDTSPSKRPRMKKILELLLEAKMVAAAHPSTMH